MDPRAFLVEECKSVRVALNETLRHDYGPERSRLYFEECKVRLQVVEQALVDSPDMDRETIAAHMRGLSALGSRISLIERSHLGEFSWPFAAIIEQVAERLFVEKSLDGDMEPIVHVVAEGTDYQIVDDEVPPPGNRRIIIVAFPRQLKHHVLLHVIFGHELAHTAINAEGPGALMKTSVLPLAGYGPLQDGIQASAWLRRDDAPPSVRAMAEKPGFTFQEQWLVNWRQEIICDLFGLMLFGPAFAAAHRTIIEALCPRPDAFDLESTTHPPYPIRQKILAAATRDRGWDAPITTEEDGVAHAAERSLLGYVTEAIDQPWFEIFDAGRIKEILDALAQVLAPYELGYVPPDRAMFCELLRRLSQERPPIWQVVDEEGVPTNHPVSGAHSLYAGWSYWFGRAALAEEARQQDPRVQELSFLELNQLCDQALLQQRAIDLVGEAPQ